ncbi:MAG: hypothetical protein JW904_10650 [Spirochaetales bacterium]|nr:hypothetical protein [Spirochaetales bacterium]
MEHDGEIFKGVNLACADDKPPGIQVDAYTWRLKTPHAIERPVFKKRPPGVIRDQTVKKKKTAEQQERQKSIFHNHNKLILSQLIKKNRRIMRFCYPAQADDCSRQGKSRNRQPACGGKADISSRAKHGMITYDFTGEHGYPGFTQEALW